MYQCPALLIRLNMKAFHEAGETDPKLPEEKKQLSQSLNQYLTSNSRIKASYIFLSCKKKAKDIIIAAIDVKHLQIWNIKVVQEEKGYLGGRRWESGGGG